MLKFTHSYEMVYCEILIISALYVVQALIGVHEDHSEKQPNMEPLHAEGNL